MKQSSSGDRSKDPYKYLKNVPRQDRVRTEFDIIRTGHLGEQVYKCVKLVHKVSKKVIYQQAL